jgi:hypothetical protein
MRLARGVGDADILRRESAEAVILQSWCAVLKGQAANPPAGLGPPQEVRATSADVGSFPLVTVGNGPRTRLVYSVKRGDVNSSTMKGP